MAGIFRAKPATAPFRGGDNVWSRPRALSTLSPAGPSCPAPCTGLPKTVPRKCTALSTVRDELLELLHRGRQRAVGRHLLPHLFVPVQHGGVVAAAEFLADGRQRQVGHGAGQDRKSTRLNSSHVKIS